MPLQPEISVPQGATSVTIGADGTVSAQLPGETAATELGKIEIARFVNPSGLAALGNNLFAETAASGTRRRPRQAATAAARAARAARRLQRQRRPGTGRHDRDPARLRGQFQDDLAMDEMLRNANQQL
jgi:flagellar basal-body rod protein FlgG